MLQQLEADDFNAACGSQDFTMPLPSMGLTRRVRRWAVTVTRAAPSLRPAILAVLRPLEAVATFILALLLVFEEWGWQPLIRLFGLLARWRPIAMLEAGLARLPPYGALVAFAIPAAVLLPFKFLALYLLAHEQPVLACLVFLAAKVVGTGVVGRIYLITQPQLMRIGWFAWAYGVFMPWKEAMLAYIRSSPVWRWGRLVKARLRRRMGRLRMMWLRWRSA